MMIIEELYFRDNKWQMESQNGYIDLNLESKKFTITQLLHIESQNPANLVSSIIPKLYQCYAKNIYLENQILSFNEFLFISSNAEEIEFSKVTVKNQDGTIATIENLVKVLPNAKSLIFDSGSKALAISFKTMAELLKIPHFLKLDSFELRWIPETFDVETFYNYAKKNFRTQFFLHFCDPISEEYMKRLEAIVDDILVPKSFYFKQPLFNIRGLNQSKNHQLQSLHCDSHDDVYY